MPRIDNRVKDAFETMLKKIFIDFRALRLGNQLLGADSLQTYVIESGSTDVNTTVAPNAVKTWRVTYTPTSMSDPFAQFTYAWAVSGGTGFEVSNFAPDTNNTSGATQAWLVQFGNDANTVTLTMFFSIKSVDTGSFTVVAL